MAYAKEMRSLLTKGYTASCSDVQTQSGKEQTMSDDLIKRSDAIKATWQEPTYTDPLNVLTEVRDRIEAIPSADRPQGEWIDYIGYDLGIEGQWLRDDGKTVFVQCDQCDSIFVRNLMTHMNFCPNCGAQMKGADDE